MPGLKRSADGKAEKPSKPSKKPRLSDKSPSKPQQQQQQQQQQNSFKSLLTAEPTDFPRGGGTSLSQYEVKEARAEARSENRDLFKTTASKKDASGTTAAAPGAAEKKGKATPKLSERKKQKLKAEAKIETTKQRKAEQDKDQTRVEHLNYKRLVAGTNVLAQVVSVRELEIIVSLPNQLWAHIPITNISSLFTATLASSSKMDLDNVSDDDESEEESEEEEDEEDDVSTNLASLFSVGQLLCAQVSQAKTADVARKTVTSQKEKADDLFRLSRRIELTLDPAVIYANMKKSDLVHGLVLHNAIIKSLEDNGVVLDTCIEGVTAFVSFDQAEKAGRKRASFAVGQLMPCKVIKMAANGRTCSVTVSTSDIIGSKLTNAPALNAIQPLQTVQCLVTAIAPSGLNVKFLGFFEGTIDLYHVGVKQARDVEKSFKLAQKVTATVLWTSSSANTLLTNAPSSDQRMVALTLLPHLVSPGSASTKVLPPEEIKTAFPVGRLLDAVKIVRIESEYGITCEILGPTESDPSIPAFVHLSRVSDDHMTSIPSASSGGKWKADSFHPARVIGYSDVDGLVQLSFQPSVLNKAFIKVEELQIGQEVKGTIKSLTDTALYVNLSGSIDAVVWPNHYSDIKLKHPERKFKAGASIKARVFSIDPARSRIVLTLRKSLVKSELLGIASFAEAKEGMLVDAIVIKVLEKGMLVELLGGLKAFIPVSEASIEYIKDIKEHFTVGQSTTLRIIKVDAVNTHLTGSIRQALTDAPLPGKEPKAKASALKKAAAAARKVDITKADFNNLSVGQQINGTIVDKTSHAFIVQLGPKLRGRLHFADAWDNYDEIAELEQFQDKAIIPCQVLALDAEQKRVDLSSRLSVLTPTVQHTVRDQVVNSSEDLVAGSKVRGFVKNIADSGLFVALGRQTTARILIRELFDGYVKDWKPKFEIGQLVEGKITELDAAANKVDMSLKKAQSKKKSLSDLKVEEIVSATVRRLAAFGVFLQIVNTDVSGLCHKSEISDDAEEWSKVVKEGKSVTAIITELDLEKKRISFSMKNSRLPEDSDLQLGPVEDDEDADVNGSESEADEEESGLQLIDDEDSETPEQDPSISNLLSLVSASTNGGIVDSEGIDEVASEEDDSAAAEVPAQSKSTNSLLTNQSFAWSGLSALKAEVAQVDSDEDETMEDTPKTITSHLPGKVYDRTDEADSSTPSTSEGFEKVLLGSPDSSYLWIQYMGLHLQQSDVVKARQIAHRALKTISFREEEEKKNIWVAILNLENSFGTEETLQEAFSSASLSNNPKHMTLTFAEILERSGKTREATEVLERGAKRFSQSSKMWTTFGTFLFTHHQAEDARALLPRALKSLPQRKHIKTICKFAQLEYRLGDAERARTIFSGIIENYPKRLDLLSIYIDAETKLGNATHIRQLFRKALEQKLSSKKAKWLFKRWLNYEKVSGDMEHTEEVKRRAQEYVSSQNV